MSPDPRQPRTGFELVLFVCLVCVLLGLVFGYQLGSRFSVAHAGRGPACLSTWARYLLPATLAMPPATCPECGSCAPPPLCLPDKVIRRILDRHLANWFADARKRHPDFEAWVIAVRDFSGPFTDATEELSSWPRLQCYTAVLNATFDDGSCQADFDRPAASCERYIKERCAEPFAPYERAAEAVLEARAAEDRRAQEAEQTRRASQKGYNR